MQKEAKANILFKIKTDKDLLLGFITFSKWWYLSKQRYKKFRVNQRKKFRRTKKRKFSKRRKTNFRWR